MEPHGSPRPRISVKQQHAAFVNLFYIFSGRQHPFPAGTFVADVSPPGLFAQFISHKLRFTVLTMVNVSRRGVLAIFTL